MTLGKICFFIALLPVALMAGLFFSFSIVVKRGMKGLDDKSYLQATQNISKEIVNPLFLLCFTGTLLSLMATTVLFFAEEHHLFMWMIVVLMACAGGVFLVTMFCNIPLNHYLARRDLVLLKEAVKAAGFRFEPVWNRYNHLRALFPVLACRLLIFIMIH